MKTRLLIVDDRPLSLVGTRSILEPSNTIEKFTKFLMPVFQLILVIFLFCGPISGLAQIPNTPDLTPEEQAWLDEDHTVRVRVGNRPPLVIHNPQPQGMAVDYLKIIDQQFDIDFEYVADNEPWIEGFEDIAGDHLRFDLYLAVTRTPERMQSYAISEDYLHSPWVVFSRLETSNILSLEDLRGKKVAVEAGFPQHDMLKKDFPEIELVLVNLTEDALRAVSSGKADASMGNLMICSYYIQRDGLSNLKVSTTTRYGVHSMGMATRKEWTPLISIINKGLASITEDERTFIRNKYIPVRFEHGITTKDVTKWALISLMSVLGIVFLFTFYNRTLKTKVDKRTLDLKTSMEALVETEERFRGVFNSISDVFTRSDMQGKCVLISPSIFNLTGYKPEEVIGRNFADFYADPKRRNEVVEILKKSKSVENFELDIVRKDGRTITVSTNAKMYFEDLGAPLGVEGIIRDITERKKAEEKLEQSEQLHRLTVEQAAVGIVHIAPGGKFLQINQKFCEITGYGRDELLSMPFANITHPDDVEYGIKQVKRLINGEIHFHSAEKRYIHKDGRIVFVNLTSQLFRNEAGEPQFFVSIVEDITKRKKAGRKILENQARLKALTKELIASEENQRRQIANDLHDHVGQILASSRLQIAAIKETTGIKDILKKLKNISSGLYDAIDSTRNAIFELSPPQLNEMGLAAAVSDWMHKEMTQYDIKYEITGDTSKLLVNNEVRYLLFRCIRELLLNVIKHARATKVIVSFEKKNDIISISVDDNGSGYTYNPDLLRTKDTGFGLFSIIERIESIDGELLVDTTPGKGTNVTLRLPLKRVKV